MAVTRFTLHSMPHSDLQDAIAEARLLVSQHDGIHHLHSDAAALILMEKCAKAGVQIAQEDVDRILKRMRRAAHTGVSMR